MPALASRALGHGLSLSFGANAAERDCVSGGGEGAVFEVFIDESRPQSHERGNSLAAVNAKTTWLTPCEDCVARMLTRSRRRLGCKSFAMC